MTTPLPAQGSTNWFAWAQDIHTKANAAVTYTDEQVRDVIGAALVAGANITITPDDAANTITIAATGGGGTVVDASTTVKGIVQLTNHLGGTATAPTVRGASETQTGIVELATTAEATTGTDTARAVTPAGLKTVADTKVTNESGVARIRVMTQAAYTALGTKVSDTLYVIQG